MESTWIIKRRVQFWAKGLTEANILKITFQISHSIYQMIAIKCKYWAQLKLLDIVKYVCGCSWIQSKFHYMKQQWISRWRNLKAVCRVLNVDADFSTQNTSDCNFLKNLLIWIKCTQRLMSRVGVIFSHFASFSLGWNPFNKVYQ